MSKGRLIMIALVAVSFKLTYDAGAPAPVEPTEDGAEAVVMQNAGVAAQLHRGLGVFGSRLAGSTVKSIVYGTRNDVADMEAAIKRAPGTRARQARELAKRIAVLDSTAIERLDSAQPIAALKMAMQGSGLADALRESLIEETVLR